MVAEKLTLKNIAGYEEEKEAVKKLIRLLNKYEEYNEKGVYIPKGFILQGPPGTGKTLLVKAISGECNIPFYAFEMSDESKDILKDLKKLFRQAEEHKPSIIYIDEIDKLVNRSSYDRSDQTRAILQFLLTKLDSINSTSGIMVTASTNQYFQLPDSLVRSGRIDKKILIDYPTASDRVEILKYYIKDNPLFSKIDLNILALKLDGMTGADIKTLVNNTIIEYLDEKDILTLDDLEKPINEMHFETIGKAWKDKKELDRVLTHELGHALVAYFLDGTLSHVSGIQYGGTAGFTSYEHPSAVERRDEDEFEELLENEQTNLTKKDFFKITTRSFGGMASEKIFYGDYDTGCVSDINTACNLFQQGMSCGIFGLNLIPEYPNTGDFSRYIASTVRTRLFKKALKKATKIIKKNKDLLVFLREKAKNNGDALSAIELQSGIYLYMNQKKILKNKGNNNDGSKE